MLTCLVDAVASPGVVATTVGAAGDVTLSTTGFKLPVNLMSPTSPLPVAVAVRVEPVTAPVVKPSKNVPEYVPSTPLLQWAALPATAHTPDAN